MTGVARYYDAATRAFLLGGRGQRIIHRELWGPGVTDARAALHHVHDLVAAELHPDDRAVLDLGCGVGTTALRLARKHPVDVTGVSISPRQVEMARRFAAVETTLRGTVRFIHADFTALPADLRDIDLALAIESYVHASTPAAFFAGAARALRPGGRLVVVDDVCTTDATDPRLDDVRAGWHVPSLVPLAQTLARAGDAGLELTFSADLSAYQRLGRPRDRLVRAALPLLRALRGRSQWAGAMVGGDALQRCHRAGLVDYRLLRFTRR